MDTAEIVNRIIEKLNGNRVKFIAIGKTNWEIAYVSFVPARNHYQARVFPASDYISIGQKISEQQPLSTNEYTEWIEGILNGMVRNDAGELVMP